MSDLPRALVLLCDDLLFAVLASESLDGDSWEDLLRRRAGAEAPPLLGGDPLSWALARIKDAAAACPPTFLPMQDLIAGGLTLNAGARGVRSLFSSKPSDKDILRVKRLGTLAFRVLGATLGADGPPSADETFQLRALLLSLGLPPDEEALLAASPLGDATALDVTGEVEPKVAAQILRGAWRAALRDGLDPREEGALTTLAGKLGIRPEDAARLRTEAEQATEASRLLGRAATDALYWLLGDSVEAARSAAVAVASLLLPDPERGALLDALARGAPPAAIDRTPLPRAARAAALGLAWLAALRTDPTLSRKAALAARFDSIARALDGDGPRVRATLDAFCEKQLLAAASSG
jgi:hypothetical protein